MIANALRAQIAQYASDMRRANPIFTRAEEGTLTPRDISQYLANLHYLLLHTPPYLKRACDRARALGDEALAKHYEHKSSEEVGHEAWAEQDIARVAPLVAVPANYEVTPSMRELVAYVARVIDEDPALYLGYILFVEYFTLLEGPAWLEMLEKRCGIPRSSMTVVGNHVELDREHVEEALGCIDDLVGDPRKLPRMRQVVAQTTAHFDRFCAEVVETETVNDARPAAGAVRHISAA